MNISLLLSGLRAWSWESSKAQAIIIFNKEYQRGATEKASEHGRGSKGTTAIMEETSQDQEINTKQNLRKQSSGITEFWEV